MVVKERQPLSRCPWALVSPSMIEYHDKEWGVPLHDDRKLFEFLVLDAFQAGLSWAIVLHKREALRRAFAGFDMEKIARFDGRKTEKILRLPGVIRNRAKIEAAVTNARAALKLQDEFGSLDSYFWSFVGGRPLQYRRRRLKDIPAQSRESRAMSRDLIARGFRFVGPVICYAFMQAAGLVNDHLTSCFRHLQVQ